MKEGWGGTGEVVEQKQMEKGECRPGGRSTEIKVQDSEEITWAMADVPREEQKRGWEGWLESEYGES